MNKGLRKLFHLDKVSPYEVGGVLLHFFSSSSGTKDGHIYQKKGEPGSIELKFNKKGDKISDIVVSDDLPKASLKIISQQIENQLLKNQETKFGQSICFLTAPVEGTFRYKDLFQISPVPGDAPKPPDRVSPNPFLLQYSFTSSPDVMVSASRREEKTTVWVRLLNVFLNKSISVRQSHAIRTWVMVPTNKHISECLQNGYNYDGFNGLIPSFSDISNEMGRMSPNEYYSERNRGIDGNSLHLPENLESLLVKAISLPPKRWDKFYRACSWYFQAESIWGGSKSASFIALVSALESLEEGPKICDGDPPHPMSTGDKCATCGEPRFDITVHFKEFMEKFIPELNEFPEERDIIYRVRSSLSHGNTLLLADGAPGGMFLMNKKAWDEDSRHRNLFLIVKTVIVRWVEAKP